MYPECRHVRPSGEGCRAAALSDSNWCYYHTRLHARQARQAERDARTVANRDLARRRQRLPNWRFAPLPDPSLSHVDRGPCRTPDAETQEHDTPSQQSHAIGSTAEQTETTAIETLDYGAYPVTTAAGEDAPFHLAPIEDAASIQLAL